MFLLIALKKSDPMGAAERQVPARGTVLIPLREFTCQFSSDHTFGQDCSSQLMRGNYSVEPGGRGGLALFAYAFTKQGVAMLSNVLRCIRAIQVNIVIMQAFVKLQELERKSEQHEIQINGVFDCLSNSQPYPCLTRSQQRLAFSMGEP